MPRACAGSGEHLKTRSAETFPDAYPPARSSPRRSPSACAEELLKIDSRVDSVHARVCALRVLRHAMGHISQSSVAFGHAI